MLLSSVNLMLYYLPHVYMLDMPCSGRPSNEPRHLPWPLPPRSLSSPFRRIPLPRHTSAVQTSQSRVHTTNHILSQPLPLGTLHLCPSDPRARSQLAAFPLPRALISPNPTHSVSLVLSVAIAIHIWITVPHPLCLMTSLALAPPWTCLPSSSRLLIWWPHSTSDFLLIHSIVKQGGTDLSLLNCRGGSEGWEQGTVENVFLGLRGHLALLCSALHTCYSLCFQRAGFLCCPEPDSFELPLADKSVQIQHSYLTPLGFSCPSSKSLWEKKSDLASPGLDQLSIHQLQTCLQTGSGGRRAVHQCLGPQDFCSIFQKSI